MSTDRKLISQVHIPAMTGGGAEVRTGQRVKVIAVQGQQIGDLFDDKLWERYGVGKDPRCASCMMHCGFESASILGALKNPKDLYKLIKEGAIQDSGVGAG